MRMESMFRCAAATAAALSLLAFNAKADDIVVAQWGHSMAVSEFAVALDQGFFKANDSSITEVISGGGGGTAVRTLIAATDASGYGSLSLSAAVQAIQSGEDIRIVNVGAQSVADTVLYTKKDSPIKSMQDLKGKSVGITNPLGWSDTFVVLAAQNAGLPVDSVKRVALGSISAATTGLMSDAVDASHLLEPMWSQRSHEFRLLFSGAQLPPMVQSVGVATGDMIRNRPEELRKILKARRDAVRAIKADPSAAAKSMIHYYEGVPLEVMEAAVKSLLEADYWSEGEMNYEAMNRLIEGIKMMGSYKGGDVDWSDFVDTSFLPKD